MKLIQSQPVAVAVRCVNYPCSFRSERRPRNGTPAVPVYGTCPRCGPNVMPVAAYNKAIAGLAATARQGDYSW